MSIRNQKDELPQPCLDIVQVIGETRATIAPTPRALFHFQDMLNDFNTIYIIVHSFI